MAIDFLSTENIATLHPKLQPVATKLIELAQAKGINVKGICGTRTYAEQNKLYAQGRTKPGNVVTKARGGESIHNFGLAFDIGIFSADDKTYHGEHRDYKVVGLIGQQLGLEWGGNWKFVDEPHFQLKHGKSHVQLSKLKKISP